MTQTQPPAETSAEEFADRLVTSTIGAFETISVYAGDRLGWYAALAEAPATAAELAAQTGTHERYAREWLALQAALGILTVDAERYVLPPGAREALTDGDSLAFVGALPRLVAAVGLHSDALLAAYRDGGGVSWADLGANAREAQADLNKPWFRHALAGALHGCADLDAVLRRDGARLLDVGCGGAWSSIALATAYPGCAVDAVDVDEATVAMAVTNVRDAGLGDRVRVRLGDGAALAGDGPAYDAAFLFECLHDLPHPVEVLAAVRAATDGPVVVMDEAVAEEPVVPGDAMEQLMYAFSLTICLPDGMSTPGSVGTGTVLRPATLRSYAEAAGFTGVDVLPVEDFGFWRFYRLTA